MKNLKKALFWILQLTWGILMNVVGLFALVGLSIAGFRPKRFGQQLYFVVGKGWGGVSLGFVTVVGNTSLGYPSTDTLVHEHGHFIQNIFYGPFMVILSLCSAARYWYREYIMYRNRQYVQNNQPEKYKKLKPYDSWWFEGQATNLGYEYVSDFAIRWRFNETTKSVTESFKEASESMKKLSETMEEWREKNNG